MNNLRLIAPGAEPYLFPGGKQACLIVHGSTVPHVKTATWAATLRIRVLLPWAFAFPDMLPRQLICDGSVGRTGWLLWKTVILF